MSWRHDDNEEDQEEEEGFGDDASLFSRKDFLIFVVDARTPMFTPTACGELPFANVLLVARKLTIAKIRAQESDQIAIVFFGTREKSNLNDFPGIYVFQDLDVPDAESIKQLEGLGDVDFSARYGHADGPVAFHHVLWVCSTMFSNRPTKDAHQRIFLFTNDDNPTGDDRSLRSQALAKAEDLKTLDIDVDLYPLGSTFNTHTFFEDILTVSEEDDTGRNVIQRIETLEELAESVRRKEFKKRSLGKVPLIMAEGIELGTRLYNTLQEAKKPSPLWLDAKTNQPVKCKTLWVCADTGTLLSDAQMKYWYEYGGSRVVFTKDELKDIKKFGSPGIQLMGFKPMSAVKRFQVTRHPYFLYPDEEAIEGSTVAFHALLKKMLEMKKVAIARFIPRANAQPRFVALYPQEETFAPDGMQETPPGMNIVFLPFADDIRNVKVPTETPRVAERGQIVAAKKVIRSLQSEFQHGSILNPSLQKFYGYLEAIALNRDQPEELDDMTLPDEQGFRNVQQMIDEFRDSVYPAGYDPASVQPTAQTATKRKSENVSGDEGRAKRTKADWEHLMSSGGLSKLTIDNLKEYLREHGLRLSGKKSELVARIEEHLRGAH